MTGKIATLIKLAGIVFPVLNSYGITITKPIVLFTTGNLSDLINKVAGAEVRVYGPEDNIKDMMKETTLYDPSVIPLIYDGEYKSISKLKKIISLMNTGQYEGKKLVRLPVIFTNEYIENELMEKVAFIEVEENTVRRRALDFHLSADDISLVMDKAKNFMQLSDVHRFFKSVTCYLYPYYSEKNKEDVYEQWQEFADDLFDMSEQVKDPAGLPDMFIDTLMEFEKQNKYPVFERDKVPSLSLEVLKESFFFDEKNVYMHNELLNRICGSLKAFAGINTIKSVLAEEKYIICNTNSANYLSRVILKDTDGDTTRPALLRFDRAKLKKLGELDFISEWR